ncbi:MAG: hypothetical protein ABIR19_05725 [Ginsengibacter sp.]
MKKILVILITGLIYNSVFNHGNAQLIGGKNNINVPDVGLNSKIGVKISKADFRSLKTFSKYYKNASDVKWFSEPGCITARFSGNQINTTVLFDKQGRWIRTTKTYQEDKMEPGIRAIVKSKYYDHKINLVKEVNEGGMLCYFIYLENDKNYTIVTLYEGEVSIYENFQKS